MATLILVFSSAACSAPERLEMPSLPDAPLDWKTFDFSLFPGSNCPNISGKFSEPPLIYRSGKKSRFTPRDNFDLYSSYIPFHLGDRKELKVNNMDLASDHFVIEQPDAAQLYFVYINGLTGLPVEYHFRSKEGDFECKDGYIEFPNFAKYGMIEGRSVNFQIRNILVKDEQGALIIQSTRGPFRGNATKSSYEFTFEFFLYPVVGEARVK